MTFTSNICRHWSERPFPTVESNMTPALLTRMSTLPNSSTALWMRSWACSSSVTSHSTAIAFPPSWDTLSTSSSRRSSRRAPAATAAPSAASARTVASPMPLEAPVTTATFPLNLSATCITSLFVRELQRGSSALCRTVGLTYPNSRETYQSSRVATSSIRPPFANVGRQGYSPVPPPSRTNPQEPGPSTRLDELAEDTGIPGCKRLVVVAIWKSSPGQGPPPRYISRL